MVITSRRIRSRLLSRRCLTLILVVLAAAACQSPSPVGSTTRPQRTVSPPASVQATSGVIPSAAPSISTAPATAVRAVRLDGARLLVMTTRDGLPTRLDVLESNGHRRQLALPSPDLGTGSFATQAFVEAGRWFLLTSDCAYAGLRLYSSTDQGRTWSLGTRVGFVGCHAGDEGELFRVGHSRVLVTSTGVGERTTITRSVDGVHWPQRPQRSDAGASTLAFQDDGSYVRVWGFADMGIQTIVHATSLGASERRVQLPGGAQPLGYTLTRTGGRYLLLSTTARPYTSASGSTWTARRAPFPGCRCTRVQFTALTATTWWAKARDGGQSRYAVTTNAGNSWNPVPGPPGLAPEYPDFLTGWNATSAVVERLGVLWLTTDRGRHWTRL